MSLRMEQALSEVISVESVPNQLDGVSMVDGAVGARTMFSNASTVTGYSNDVSVSHSRNAWIFEMQIWLLMVELFLKLDLVST